MDFERLDKKTNSKDIYVDPRKIKKASVARRIVVFGMLLLAPTTPLVLGGCKEQIFETVNQKNEEKRVKEIKELSSTIENAINNFQKNENLKSMEYEIRRESEVFNLDRNGVFDFINSCAKNHPEINFGIRYERSQGFFFTILILSRD